MAESGHVQVRMSEQPLAVCPFRAGDVVFYRPLRCGLGPESAGKLVPGIGEPVRIERVIDGLFVVWEQCEVTGEGIYWTEFSAT